MNPSNPSSTPSSSFPESAAAGSNPSDSKNEAGNLKQSAANTARTTAERAKQSASEVVAQAKEKVSHLAEEQKETVAHRIGSYSSAIRETAKSMEDEDPNIAYYVNQAADRIEQTAGYVRNLDLNRLRSDGEGIARRHPALFMGGMFVAGMVLGNLVKASARSMRDDDYDEGFAGEDDEMYRPTGYDSSTATVGTTTPGTVGGTSSSTPGSGEASGTSGSAAVPPGTEPYGRSATGI